VARTRAPLAPIRKTVFADSIIGRGAAATRRRECWGAETTDDTWDFERVEVPGTPWLVRHRPTGTVVDSYVGSLLDCRAYVASGGAQKDLELIQAHERREHDAQRRPACVKC
jgi:hypothetical protein